MRTSASSPSCRPGSTPQTTARWFACGNGRAVERGRRSAGPDVTPGGPSRPSRSLRTSWAQCRSRSVHRRDETPEVADVLPHTGHRPVAVAGMDVRRHVVLGPEQVAVARERGFVELVLLLLDLELRDPTRHDRGRVRVLEGSRRRARLAYDAAGRKRAPEDDVTRVASQLHDEAVVGEVDRGGEREPSMEEESIDGGSEQHLGRVLADRCRAVVLARVDGVALPVAAPRPVTVVTGLAVTGLHDSVAAVGAVRPAGDAGDRRRAGRVAGLSGIEDPVAAFRREARLIRAGLRVDLGARRVHAEEVTARIVAHVDGAR